MDFLTDIAADGHVMDALTFRLEAGAIGGRLEVEQLQGPFLPTLK
jgi:hypothetical protein